MPSKTSWGSLGRGRPRILGVSLLSARKPTGFGDVSDTFYVLRAPLDPLLYGTTALLMLGDQLFGVLYRDIIGSPHRGYRLPWSPEMIRGGRP